MKYSKLYNHFLSVAVLVVGVFFVMACNENSQSASSVFLDHAEAKAKFVSNGNQNVVEATAIHNHDTNEHKFLLSTDEIQSGWTSFRFKNASDSDHFFLLYKIPDEAVSAAEDAGQSMLEHWYETVTVPFQEEFNPYISGDITYGDFVNNLIGTISSSAPWFLNPGATPMGGPGITAAGRTSETTVNLSAGRYIVECYVKDENQEFHSFNGMLDIMTVTDESNGQRRPKATMEVTISQEGIVNPEKVRPGKHNVAIKYGEQPQFGYEHLLGHNVQLVRLEDNYDQVLLDELEDWMDWTQENGLVNRAPEGADFLGGNMEMPGGSTAFFSVILKPGNYAWIAEVPDPSTKDMLKTFTVPFGRKTGSDK